MAIISTSPAPPISPAEAARRLGLDQVTKDPHRAILRMVRAGDLVGVRVGKYTLVNPKSVDEYMGRG